jgi:hypothetical protein
MAQEQKGWLRGYPESPGPATFLSPPQALRPPRPLKEGDHSFALFDHCLGGNAAIEEVTTARADLASPGSEISREKGVLFFRFLEESA